MKLTDIHVAVFPIGSIVKFTKSRLKRSDGSNEYYRMIWTLVRQKHISKVSIVQKSDWDKLNDVDKEEFDPRGVIFDAYSHYGLKTPQKVHNGTQKEACYYLWDHMKEQDKPDFGIAFPAQGFAMVNIPNLLPQLRTPDKLCAALNMTVRYAGPIVHWINKSKVPYYLIATDPRYCKPVYKRRDVSNRPLELLAQYNDKIEFHAIGEDYDNYKFGDEEPVTNIDVTYSGVEKMNLIGEKIVPPDNNERTNKFAVVAMQSSYGKNDIKDYRFNILKNWVFKYDEKKETKVYGKWAEIFTDDNPQFKGFLPPGEIDELFENTRYTLVIPIRPDWVTSKYAEMLRVGVVPFLHPDYDTQFNALPEDAFIRVKTPEEFYKKMEYLDEHPKKRIALIKRLQLQLLKGVRKGEFIIDMLNKHNEKHGIDVKIPYEFDETMLRTRASKTLF